MQSSAPDNAPSPRSSAAAAAARSAPGGLPNSKMTANSAPSDVLADGPPALPPAPSSATKSVRFSSTVRARSIPGLSFMTDEERRGVWYCENDLSSFKETLRPHVRHLRHVLRQAEQPPSPDDLYTFDTDEHCCRGIEHFATLESLLRQETAKTALIQSVLREQGRLSAAPAAATAGGGATPAPEPSSRKHDSSSRTDAVALALSHVSMRLSLQARTKALALGASDRAFAAREEAGLRAILASHSLARCTAATDGTAHGAAGGLVARAASPSTLALQPTPAPRPLKRSASSVPDMTQGISVAAAAEAPSAEAILSSYEQFVTHRRRRLDLLRGTLLAAMDLADNCDPRQQQGGNPQR